MEKLIKLAAMKHTRTTRQRPSLPEIDETKDNDESDRLCLSDRLDPELKNFLKEIKAENDRDVELTVVNDTPMFFGLSEQFDNEDADKLNRFVEHLTIKINGKEIPQNAVEKIRIRRDKPAITFSFGIKNNKLLSLGTLFKNAVASLTDKLKETCLKIINPMSVQFIYRCPLKEQELRSDEPLSIATLIYKHPEMAEALNFLENPQFTKMLRFVKNYGRWPQWWDVEFHLPELEKTT
jgi:hypothetical protein